MTPANIFLKKLKINLAGNKKVLSLYYNINHKKKSIMGTRSTYRIIEEYSTGKKVKKVKHNEICLIYRQYDGYPTGHPLETAEWLSTGKVVNGYGANEKKLVFNGAGCLAAQLIWKLKGGETGNTYVQSLSSRGNSWEDYLYDDIVKEDYSIEFVCYENDGNKTELFRGTPSQFVKKYKKEEVEKA